LTESKAAKRYKFIIFEGTKTIKNLLEGRLSRRFFIGKLTQKILIKSKGLALDFYFIGFLF